MKHYKLLKDLPTFKAGDLFYISEYGALVYDDGGYGVMAYAQSTLDRFPNILTEWFEEVQKPTSGILWKPKKDDKYYCLGNNSGRLFSTFWTDTALDDTRLKLGNVYSTMEEAEQALGRKLAEVRLRRTSNFEPDFKSKNGGWVVGYNYHLEELVYSDANYVDYGEPVRYATEEDAKKSIKENREDWLIYFGIDPSDTNES